MNNIYYTFSSKLSTTTVQAHPLGLNPNSDDLNLFDQHKLILGEYDNISFPVIFKQVYGKNFDDVLDTGWVSLFLISERMKMALEENHLTGWKTFSIKLFDKENNEIKGYYGFSVLGKSGKIDYRNSKIIEKQIVPNGPFVKFYIGLDVGLNEWDGSDFFLPQKSFGIIITKKAANIIKKLKLTNIRMKNLLDIEKSEIEIQNSIL